MRPGFRTAPAALSKAAEKAQAVFNQGLALHQKGQLAQARELYQQVLKLQPRHFDATHLTGVAAYSAKQPALAVEWIRKALLLNPKNAFAWNNLGLATGDTGQAQAALEHFDRAIALKADYAEAYCNRGTVLRQMGQADAAIKSYDQAIALKADYVEAHYNRGNVLRSLGQPEAAIASYQKALALKPAYAEAHNNSANAWGELKDYRKAVACYEQAIALQPNHAAAYCNRGDALGYLHHYQEAVASFDRAIALKPAYADAYINRGNALGNLKQHRAAIESYEKAISLQPDRARAHLNLAFCLLQIGEFQSGWKQQEWRWQEEDARKISRGFTQPLWLGEGALQGKTILLHAEQGLGDTLQFCRYAKHVSALGARVILEVPAPLLGILAGLEGVAQLVARGSTLPAFDAHCPLLSLPLAFGTDLANMPDNAAYLRVPEEKMAAWAERLGEKTRPRVALVWRGNASHINDRNRSMALSGLIEHLPQGLDYISLQKELGDGDRDTLLAHPQIRCFEDGIKDFTDTAALCALVDVVLSVDTSVAHLAGALGRPVWIALPSNPDWRWMLERDDSPWYPSARLYRQSSPGQWDDVVARMAHDLALLAALPAHAGVRP